MVALYAWKAATRDRIRPGGGRAVGELSGRDWGNLMDQSQRAAELRGRHIFASRVLVDSTTDVRPASSTGELEPAFGRRLPGAVARCSAAAATSVASTGLWSRQLVPFAGAPWKIGLVRGMPRAHAIPAQRFMITCCMIRSSRMVSDEGGSVTNEAEAGS